MLVILVEVLLFIINLLIIVLIVQAVMSWLLAFQIISLASPIVDTIWRFTRTVTDPMLRPIRRFIPPVSGMDFSPLVLLLLLYLLSRLIPSLLLGIPF